MIEQQQKTGYTILFNLLFRIPLTLFGLFFSLIVFNAMVWLLDVTLYPAMAGATANSLFGVLGVITYIVLITGANYTVANRSFALINQVPDRVTRWFGANDHGDESHRTNVAVGIVTGGARAALDGLTQGGKGAMVASMGKGRAKETNAPADAEKKDAPKKPTGDGPKGAPSERL